MKRHYLLLFLPPLLFATCLRPSDDDMDMNTVNDELPPITMEGAQTFGCLVNGVVFVNRPALFNDNISMSYNEPASNFDLTASSSSPENQTVNQKFIFMNATFSDIGEASFNDAGYEEEGAGIFLPSRQDIPLDENNYLGITRFDLEEHIISGTFAFVVIDTICHDTFRITEGRFDYDYAN